MSTHLKLFALALTACASGCAATLVGYTAQQITCERSHIEVSNARVEPPYFRRWDARCADDDARYACSGLSTGSGAVIRCAPAP